MKKNFIYLLLLCSLIAQAQVTPSYPTIKLTKTIEGVKQDSLLVVGADKIVKHIPASKLGTVKSVTGIDGVTVANGTTNPIIGISSISQLKVVGLVTDLSNKVDKVAGKSLISDTEITRLSTVVNQDISGKEDSFSKNTAFNKNFGVLVNTVSEGNHLHSFSDLQNNPTTIAGYGITDANKSPINVNVTTVRTTAAKIGTTSSGTYTPSIGDRIDVTFTLGTAIANATLNIDGSGVKAIQLAGTNVTALSLSTPASLVVIPMYYNGTAWQIYGSTMSADANTTYIEATTGLVVTNSTQVVVVNTLYYANNASNVAFTLPTTCAVNSIVHIVGMNSTGTYSVIAPSGDNIILEGNNTGAGGILNGSIGSTLVLRCTVANTTWSVVNYTGQIVSNTGYSTNKESTVNKSNSYSVSSAVTYPSTKALVDGLETKISGTLTTNRIPKSFGTKSIGDSSINDNGTTVTTNLPIHANSFVKSIGSTNLLLASGSDITQASLPISTATQAALDLKENSANKQNSLAVDGTGGKFPTVDAIKKVITYTTPEEFGAVGDGVADDKTAIQNAVNSGETVFFGNKRYFISGSVTLPAGCTIIGASTGEATNIFISANEPAFIINGNNITIQSLSILGSNPLSNPNQHGIALIGSASLTSSFERILISNCAFYDLGGAGFYSRTNGATNFSSAQISNSYAYQCRIGFWFADRAEYNNLSNIKAHKNEIGIILKGGNNLITGLISTYNDVNVKLEGSLNDGHTSISGGEINHANTYNVFSDGLTLGYTFNSCAFYAGDILIKDSKGVRFLNSEIGATNNIYFQNSTESSFTNVAFLANPAFYLKWNGTNNNGVESEVKFFNNNFWAGTPSSVVNNEISDGLVVTNGDIKAYEGQKIGFRYSSVTPIVANYMTTSEGDPLSFFGMWTSTPSTEMFNFNTNLGKIVSIYNNGNFQINGSYQSNTLAGTGTRLVSASPTGQLSASNTAYLPLSGGTLTGAISGTSATFSETVTASPATLPNHVVVKSQLDAVASGPYKVYTALLNQSGTSAPVATVLENTLGGTVVWSYASTGVYVANLTGAFTINKTIVFTSNAAYPVTPPHQFTGGVRSNSDSIQITSKNGSGTLTNDLISSMSLEIRVYN